MRILFYMSPLMVIFLDELLFLFLFFYKSLWKQGLCVLYIVSFAVKILLHATRATDLSKDEGNQFNHFVKKDKRVSQSPMPVCRNEQVPLWLFLQIKIQKGSTKEVACCLLSFCLLTSFFIIFVYVLVVYCFFFYCFSVYTSPHSICLHSKDYKKNPVFSEFLIISISTSCTEEGWTNELQKNKKG